MPSDKKLAPPEAGTPSPAETSTVAPDTHLRRPAQATSPQVPCRLGSYELIERLGRGGMGEVYRARHVHLDKLVAVKLIASDVTPSPDLAARFRREALAAGRVEHPNLVRATDAGEADGALFLAMELLQGEDLNHRTNRLGPLPVAEACDAIRQAALRLHQAHAQGLVHRDVKPHNLFRTEDGVVKVLDLGLARLRGGSSIPGSTHAGGFMGTADYAAPEQFLDASAVEAPADIYALGCTFFQLLTGAAPFGDETHATTISKMNAHLSEAPPDLRRLRPDVPAPLLQLTARMLAKKPEDRPGTAAEVADALAAFTVRSASPVPDEQATSLHHEVASSGRRRRLLVAGLLTVLLALAGWAAVVQPWRNSPAANGIDPSKPEPEAKPLTARLRLTRFAPEKSGLRLVGELGTDHAFRTRYNDRVEVEALLSEPAYAYLIAFNPADKPEDQEQLLPRSEADQPPPLRDRLSPDSRLKLDDGKGLQAFAVVASRQLLPPYAEWRKQRRPLKWEQVPATSGVVWLADGDAITGLYEPGFNRATEEKIGDKALLRELARALRRQPGVETVTVIGFAVDLEK